MRSVTRLVLAAIISAAATQSHAALPVAVNGQPLPTLAPLLEQVTPAVVNIHSSTRIRVRQPFADDPVFRRFFGLPRERVSRSLGSGVIVDASKGYILTNNHVIEGATLIEVTLSDGRNFTAELIGTDPDTDVGVIRIDAPDLTELPLQSAADMRVGDFVVAVGNPFGLGQTVTSGIVSAVGRRGLRGLNFQNFIQTDASINPGNSGGALLDLSGRLIGINTAIFSPSGGNVGIGFAIPADIARNVMDDLVAYGAVRRGRLGVSLQALTSELTEVLGLSQTTGALITRVQPDSDAERAGLVEGDVIIALGGEKITDPAALRNAEGLLPIGRPVRVDYLRDGLGGDLSLTLSAAAPTELDGHRIHKLLSGIRLKEIEPAIADRAGVTGLLISEVKRGSAASRAGIRPGDIIHRIDRQPVSSLADASALAEADADALVLSILRGSRSYLVVLQ